MVSGLAEGVFGCLFVVKRGVFGMKSFLLKHFKNFMMPNGKWMYKS